MANIKFSQFTAEADIANFDDIVGYAGAVNTRITPANLASSLITLSGGPYLPLTAGASEKLTGDLNLAATGAGPSVGSQAVVFNGSTPSGVEFFMITGRQERWRCIFVYSGTPRLV